MNEPRAVLLPPPDMPGYDELPDGLKARQALPARFHIPMWEDTSDRPAFLCAVCWDELTVSEWPCATATASGREVFEVLSDYRAARVRGLLDAPGIGLPAARGDHQVLLARAREDVRQMWNAAFGCDPRG